jgi:hypothetical protein
MFPLILGGLICCRSRHGTVCSVVQWLSMDWEQASQKLMQLFPVEAERMRIKDKLLSLPLDQALRYFHDTDAVVRWCLQRLISTGECCHSCCLASSLPSSGSSQATNTGCTCVWATQPELPCLCWFLQHLRADIL